VETNEKRRFLRFPNESEVKIKMNDTLSSYPMEDFSAGGFRISYVEDFEIGQIVEAEIDFDYGQFVTKAKVKWINKERGVGFEFIDLEMFS
jgi:hypothetical protein